MTSTSAESNSQTSRGEVDFSYFLMCSVSAGHYMYLHYKESTRKTIFPSYVCLAKTVKHWLPDHLRIPPPQTGACNSMHSGPSTKYLQVYGTVPSTVNFTVSGRGNITRHFNYYWAHRNFIKKEPIFVEGKWFHSFLCPRCSNTNFLGSFTRSVKENRAETEL